MSQFQNTLIQVVQMIPSGRVMSYGQVAAYMGVPRGARQVGRTLRGLETTAQIPWWRIINNTGRISIDGNLYNDKHVQRKLLEAEHVIVLDNYTLDIDQYRYIPSDKELKKMHLDEDYVSMLHAKFFQK